MAMLQLTIPSDASFESLDGWQHLGGDTYAAVQAHILVVRRRDNTALKGFPFKTLNFPANTEYSVQNKSIRVIKHAGKIQETIQDTLSSKFSAELVTKLAAEIGISASLPSGKLTTEAQAKAGAELAEAMQYTIAKENSFEIEDTREVVGSISVKPDDGTGKPLQLSFYLSFWPCYYDVYLYRLRYLRLRYQKHWYWWNVRDTIETTEHVLKRPLFRIKYFEPQNEYSITDNDYTPDISADEALGYEIVELSVAMPATAFQEGESLEKLAKLAFPVSSEEKRTAGSRPGAKKIARRHPPRPAAKTAGRKKAAKALVKSGGRKKATKVPINKKPTAAARTRTSATAKKTSRSTKGR
jgi:hypothetical protein